MIKTLQNYLNNSKLTRHGRVNYTMVMSGKFYRPCSSHHRYSISGNGYYITLFSKSGITYTERKGILDEILGSN